MASGDIIAQSREFLHWKALDAAGVSDNGVWVDIAIYSGQIAFHVTGTTTAGNIQFRGSNAATKPSNATDGAPLGSTIGVGTIATTEILAQVGPSSGITGWIINPRWVKVRTDGTIAGGTVSVNCIVRVSG